MLFLGFLHQARLRNQDVHAQSVFIDIEGKLYDYTYKQQQVPESLSTVGVRQVPSYIAYKKVAPNRYRLCVTYKSSYVPPYQGHKGSNCQENAVYVRPFIKNKDGSYGVCDVKDTHYIREGHIIQPPAQYPDSISVDGQLFFYSSASKAFDEKCDALGQSDLHIGDKVDVFDIVPPHSAAAVSIFLKRS